MPLLYPVFCTAEIPLEVLNNLIRDSSEGLATISGSGCLQILSSTSISDDSPSLPATPFTSPFLNKTLSDIYTFYTSTVKPNKAYTCNTFAVLDEQTKLDGKTLLQCSDMDGELKTIRSDFYASLFNMVPMEMGTVGIEDVEDVKGDQSGVLDREAVEEVMGGGHQE